MKVGQEVSFFFNGQVLRAVITRVVSVEEQMVEMNVFSGDPEVSRPHGCVKRVELSPSQVEKLHHLGKKADGDLLTANYERHLGFGHRQLHHTWSEHRPGKGSA